MRLAHRAQFPERAMSWRLKNFPKEVHLEAQMPPPHLLALTLTYLLWLKRRMLTQQPTYSHAQCHKSNMGDHQNTPLRKVIAYALREYIQQPWTLLLLAHYQTLQLYLEVLILYHTLEPKVVAHRDPAFTDTRRRGGSCILSECQQSGSKIRRKFSWRFWYWSYLRRRHCFSFSHKLMRPDPSKPGTTRSNGLFCNVGDLKLLKEHTKSDEEVAIEVNTFLHYLLLVTTSFRQLLKFVTPCLHPVSCSSLVLKTLFFATTSVSLIRITLWWGAEHVFFR